jgi:hypothetical protein
LLPLSSIEICPGHRLPKYSGSKECKRRRICIIESPNGAIAVSTDTSISVYIMWFQAEELPGEETLKRRPERVNAARDFRPLAAIGTSPSALRGILLFRPWPSSKQYSANNRLCPSPTNGLPRHSWRAASKRRHRPGLDEYSGNDDSEMPNVGIEAVPRPRKSGSKFPFSAVRQYSHGPAA